MYPSVVPDHLIEYIRRHEKDYEERAVSIDAIRTNDTVAFLDGMFAGYEGVFRKYDGEERALVLLHFLGQLRLVKVPASVLKVI